jgi:NADPH:quinone reductase-like Zn-dependent oxidoreductase
MKGVEGGLIFRKDVATPVPGRGQVLVQIHAVSLNFRDVAALKGEYPASSSPNGIPVSDGAGLVVALGEDITEWKVGDRVAMTCNSHQGGSMRWFHFDDNVGFQTDGVLAQYIIVDQTGIVDIGSLSYEEAATLPCAGTTAWNALYCGSSPLKSGRVVLVQGTGGVSILAAQIAMAAGARVIGTSSSDDKLARLEEMGVAKQDLINYRTTPEWSKRVLELTNGRGVDYIMEVGGASTINQSVACVRCDGEVSLIGFLGGLEGGGLNPLDVLKSGATLRSILIGSREMFRELLEAIHHNKIHPVIDKVFPFDQATGAFKYLESGAHFGKVIIKVA